MKHRYPFLLTTIAASAAIFACGDDDADPANGEISRPLTYQFESRFEPGMSSVAYSGQTKRHLLIETIKSYIGGLDDQTFTAPEEDDVVNALWFFYDFKTAGDPGSSIQVSTGALPATQSTWADLGGNLVSLQEKFPEFDAGFDGDVIGYESTDRTPEGVLRDMFERLEALIIRRANGDIPVDPDGIDIPAVYVSETGIDYQQLIQKYLGGAVAISQGTDDYLDDDTQGKGLLSDNENQVEGAAYTALEHIWDEGFGYFGAARNYGDFTDDEIAGAGGRDDWQGVNDANGDGRIDFLSEYNFGHAVNAAKRDRGATVATDYTKTAFDAFLAGRTLIVNAGGNLDDAQLNELRGYRDAVVGAWERAVAATVVHYINDVLQDMAAFDNGYDFLAHAKHWSEMKGFALALQFNVNHSPMSAAQMQSLHDLLSDRPVLPTDGVSERDNYATALNTAKTQLGQIYQFDAENLGDTDGLNGW